MKNKKLLIGEVFLVFFLIQIHIWFTYTIAEWLSVIPIMFIVTSWWRQYRQCGGLRHFAEELGLWRPKRLSWTDWLLSGAGRLMLGGSLILVFILTLGFIYNPGSERRVLSTTAALWVITYFGWAMIQQIAFQGYMVDRLMKVWDNRWKTSLIGSVIFAAIHAPNPVLMPITFAGGIIGSLFFLQNRFIYIIALMHAFLGVATGICLPEEWHQNLTIGNYFLEKLNKN